MSAGRHTRTNGERVKVTAAVGFFGVLTIVFGQLLSSQSGIRPGEGLGLMLLSISFTLMGAAFLLHVWSPGWRAGEPPGRSVWIGLGIGMALWLAVPLVMLGNGMAWTDTTGAGRYRVPVWLLTALLYFTVAAAAFGFGRQALRRRRARAATQSAAPPTAPSPWSPDLARDSRPLAPHPNSRRDLRNS